MGNLGLNRMSDSNSTPVFPQHPFSTKLCCTRKRRPTDPSQTLTIDCDLYKKIKTSEKEIFGLYNRINESNNALVIQITKINGFAKFNRLVFSPFFKFIGARIPDCTLQPTGEEQLKTDEIQK